MKLEINVRRNFNILSNKEWKESDYGNPLNTTTDSFFKGHDERNIKEGNELRQMKCKGDNKNDEQPIKRVCKAEKFEAIKYSLGPKEEYIAVRRCEYDTWERNEESMSQIYQEIFQKKDNRWKDLAAKESTMLVKYLQSGNLEVYVLTTPIPEDGKNATIDQIRRRNKWDNDDYVCRGLILNGPVISMTNFLPSWKVLKAYIDENIIMRRLTLVELAVICAFRKSLRDDDVAWWVDSGATVHVCKDRCWFKTYESLNDGSILHMGNESTTLVHGRGCVDLRFSSGKIVSLLNIVNDNIASAFMSTSKLNDSILWHARLGHVHFKRMQDMSKDGLIPAFDMDTEKCKTCMLTKITKKPFQNVKRKTEVLELIYSDLCNLHATPSSGNKKYFVTFIDDASRFCYVYLLHSKDEALDKFKVFKTEVELQQGS
ncbi:zinc finger, CCHC-type containing protein [Tanacetum coccineum]